MAKPREFTAASFNQFLNEKKLMASRCKKCQTLYLPPRPLCIKCGDKEEMEWVEMKGKGRLAAFTAISVGPSFMIAEGYNRTNPYCSGIVELDEGPKISARILGVDAQHPEQIELGMPLKVEFLERGQGEKRTTFLAFKA